MKIERLAPFADVLLLRPTVHRDDRGFFLEIFHLDRMEKALESSVPSATFPNFVQDNHSRSNKGVLRGIHFQRAPHGQAKLVRVARGRVFDVAVDLRANSPTFGKWAGMELSDDDHAQLYIPQGYGHAFLVLEDNTDFIYKTSDYYAPASEGSVAWNDPSIGIDWPFKAFGIETPVLSGKDKAAPALAELTPL